MPTHVCAFLLRAWTFGICQVGGVCVTRPQCEPSGSVEHAPATPWGKLPGAGLPPLCSLSRQSLRPTHSRGRSPVSSGMWSLLGCC